MSTTKDAVPSATVSGMDALWSIEDWKSSALSEGAYRQPSPEALADAATLVSKRTKEIYEKPYNPGNWLVRSKALSTLGYPELATADAYKALILCNASISEDQDLLDKIVSIKGLGTNRTNQNRATRTAQTHDDRSNLPDSVVSTLTSIRQEACYVLINALEMCMSYHEAIDYCRESFRDYRHDERFAKLYQRLIKFSNHPDAHKGGYSAVYYPWMAKEHRKRSASVLALANTHIQGISNGMCTIGESSIVLPVLTAKPSKQVRWLDHDHTKSFTITGQAISRTFLPTKNFDKRSKLSRQTIAVPESDVLGVFATRNISSGTRILTDVTVTGAASVQTSASCSNCYTRLGRTRHTPDCCSSPFCTVLCRDLAMASYHPSICANPELAWVAQDAAYHRSSHPRGSLLLRFLATAAGAGTHPLTHELAASLCGPSTGHISSFTLRESVAAPIRMLRELGEDVFADARWESWALLMLQLRIAVNRRVEPAPGGGFLVAVNPCFSLFNHSCEPNAAWQDGGTATVEIRAGRDIQAGEEIFLNYASGEWLSYWFGGAGCLCPKCRREAAPAAQDES